jgi:hypothetical protein
LFACATGQVTGISFDGRLRRIHDCSRQRRRAIPG